MIRLSILALVFVTMTSCSSYTVARYEIENVLAVTKAGDTIQVPLSELKRQYNYNTFSDWQFYYGNNLWYNWYDWRLRYPTWNMWYYDWYRPYGRTIGYYNQPKTRYVPRREVPQTRPRVQINGRRNETNTTNPRSTQQTQTRSDGRRSWSREVVPSQSTRPRISTPSQPRQIRRGSQQPRIQQTQPRGRSSQQGSRPINERKN